MAYLKLFWSNKGCRARRDSQPGHLRSGVLQRSAGRSSAFPTSSRFRRCTSKTIAFSNPGRGKSGRSGLKIYQWKERR